MDTTQIDRTQPTKAQKAKRRAVLRRGGRVFHVVFAQQFDRPVIAELCRLAEMIRKIASFRPGNQYLQTLLNDRRAMLYFIQPSTRTFLSFSAATQIVGMRYNEVRNPSTSSEAKGETEEDTIGVLSQYFDVIIMRHYREGFAEHVAHMLNASPRPIPVINAGSGKDQHPTQALLDIYTLFRCFAGTKSKEALEAYGGNPFKGKTVGFVGDLRRGRTVRSLTYLLCRYPGVRLLFISPPELQIGEDILDYVHERRMSYETSDDLRKHIGELDAVYMTRLQDEYDLNEESKSIDYDRFALTREMARDFKPDLAILHPLPRRKELDGRLDSLPQAKYWKQVRNGMWMRAALLAYVFHVDKTIREHYENYYTF
jgi:aspartate carbamoyltransferase catalytic subunit